MAYKLLASSNTVQGITDMVNKFYCSVSYTVNSETLAIEHPTRPMSQAAVRVVKVKGRYRFECML